MLTEASSDSHASIVPTVCLGPEQYSNAIRGVRDVPRLNWLLSIIRYVYHDRVII